MPKRQISTTRASEILTLIDSMRRDTNMKGFERWRAIGDTVTTDLKKGGEFFNTEEGLFYFDEETGRAFSLDDNAEFSALMGHRYGLNKRMFGFKNVLADLQSETVRDGRKIEARRLAYFEHDRNELYVSRFDGEYYVLDGNSVRSLPNGSRDVFFFDNSQLWQPYSYTPNTAKGEFDRQIIESVNFLESDLSVPDQQLFLRLWVMAVFFGNVQPTKIILLLLGDHGAGKTSALRRIQKLIFGDKVNLLSIEKDKQDGFIATITTDPIALFDNLDEQIQWLPYNLSRLATGITFSRRQLYTTNDKVEFPGVSWLGITARTVDFMRNQPDLPDRTLVLKLGRLQNRQPEQELLNAVAQRRNALWSELLDELNAIVRYLKEHPEPIQVRFRMADFASFALKVGTLWGCRQEVENALGKLEAVQSGCALAGDPIHQVLRIWLRDEANHGRSLAAGALQQEWSKVAKDAQITWPFANGSSLAQSLSQLQFALREECGVSVNYDTHAKQNLYGFQRKQPNSSAQPLIRPADSEEVLEFAGVAGVDPAKP
jgi:hypothetical protein